MNSCSERLSGLLFACVCDFDACNASKWAVAKQTWERSQKMIRSTSRDRFLRSSAPRTSSSIYYFLLPFVRTFWSFHIFDPCSLKNTDFRAHLCPLDTRTPFPWLIVKSHIYVKDHSLLSPASPPSSSSSAGVVWWGFCMMINIYICSLLRHRPNPPFYHSSHLDGDYCDYHD